MPSYPKFVKQELLRINQEWYRTGLPERLPFPQRNGDDSLRVEVTTPPGLFEQATEYHRRQALEKLEDYWKEPTQSRAEEAAQHMMYANLASQCFNQIFGQDPLADLPFPVD
jgi:hypothetical protein